MSLETGLVLAEKAYRYTSGIVKTPVVKKSEIVLSALKPAIGDVCTFAKTDPTLFPGFVKDLLKTEGTGIERIQTITKSFLERMGYNPEILEVVNDSISAKIFKSVETNPNVYSAAFSFPSGKMLINDKFLNAPNEVMIPIIRHELEHASQIAKVYKAKGGEAAKKAIEKKYEINNLPMEEFNKSFYDEFSKYADVTDANIEEYYKAIVLPYVKNDDFINSCIYYNNGMEAKAYDVQEKIGKIISSELITGRETFPHNGMAINNLLEQKGCPSDEKVNAYNVMFSIIRVNIQSNAEELYYMAEHNPGAYMEFVKTIPSKEEYDMIFAEVEKELKNMTKEEFQNFLDMTIHAAKQS